MIRTRFTTFERIVNKYIKAGTMDFLSYALSIELAPNASQDTLKLAAII
jgi:hypothetical protein